MTQERDNPVPKVLVVDDDPTIRDLLQRILTNEGFLVQTADGPVSAVEILRTAMFQAVVLDIRMPGSSGEHGGGLDVLTFMRSQEALRSIPVLILTGGLLTEPEEKAILELQAYVFNKSEGHHTLVEYLKHLTTKI